MKINKSKQKRSLGSGKTPAGQQDKKAADGSKILKLLLLFLQPIPIS